MTDDPLTDNPATYDPQAHAQLLSDYCLAAQPGERVLVQASTLALPLVEALHRELLRRGAVPLIRLEYPQPAQDFLKYAPDALIDALDPLTLAEIQGVQASLRILTPTLPGSQQAGADPGRAARWRRAQAPIAAARAQRRWNLTLYPTDAGAQAAGMTLPAYRAFVASAMFLDAPDPAARWAEVRAFQARLIERLSRADEVHILADGCDLRLSVKGRSWANSDGKRNMPSGEVFTGPHEGSAEGHMHFDLPTIFAGQPVSGVRLSFRSGRVVSASAEEGEDTLLAALETDAGARLLGELGIGSNSGIQRASRNILFDEKIGGTVHLALGSSYPETGGVNQSALHWDLISDLRRGGELRLDGEVFQRGGVFVL